jgi:hypothetical protein
MYVIDEQICAQSFRPSLSPLVRVDLYMFLYQNDTSKDITTPLKVSIRKNLSGDDLTSITMSPAQIFSYPEWIECDFSDIIVYTDYTYYIVCMSSLPRDIGFYGWNMIRDESRDRYIRGKLWLTNEENNWTWHHLDNLGRYHDFCFKTYSLRESPEPPTITGPTMGKSGKEYTYAIVTTDPEGDEVSYYIDWGDGADSGWTRYRQSGSPLNTSHIWARMGIFSVRVKAKDIYGAESNWTTLRVTIPKNRVFNLWLHDIFKKLLHECFQTILS